MNNLSLNGNYVDLIILVIFIYFISEAWTYGFWIIIADFVSFFLSLILALWGYSYVGEFLRSNFSLDQSLSKAIGFFVVAGLAQSLIGFFAIKIIKKIPYKLWKKPWNNIAAIAPALGQGIIIVSFILTLLISLPFAPKIKKDISDSRIGSFLVSKTSGFEVKTKEVFGGLAEDSLTYLTVRQGSQESTPIDYEVQELTVDEISENEMLNLVNEERKKVGVSALTWRSDVVPIARAHARDMWERQYFSHYSPEGKDIGDRLNDAGISYRAAGENLALAPTLQTAHTGLMNSEGHRRNILDPDFKRLGIGVIDNGIYGKMFVQIFSD